MTEEQALIVNDCIKRSKELTEWELNFMNSIKSKDSEYQLTDDQEYIVESVWERVTS